MCKVSVIMPVYNGEKFLKSSIDSALSQTLKDIELICIDDGSTDNSLKILKESAGKDSRIILLTQTNSGSGKARNKGISYAHGEYLAFLDSDDLYPTKGTLEKMYKSAIKHNALICGGSLNQLVGDKVVANPKSFEEEYTFEKDGFVNFKDYQFDYGYWRFIYKCSFIKKNKIQFPNYLRQQDPPFFLKAMILAGNFYALKAPTYIYRVSHKEIHWTERKVVDMFKSISDSLDLAAEYQMDRLYCSLFSHINTWTFQKAVATTVKFSSVREQVLKTLNQIDFAILTANNVNAKFSEIYQALYKGKSTHTLISIIVPVYNVERYLPRCLDSLLAQTMPLIEIICVNDGSTDKSREVLEKYAQKDKRIIIVDKKNGGLSSARNKGIEIAKSDYIMFVDSDDWIDSSTAEEALSHMVKDVDIVSWGAEVINEGLSQYNNGVYRARQYHAIKLSGEYLITTDVIKQSTYTAWNKLFRKSIIRNYDLTFTEGRLFEDNDFLIKYFVHCRRGFYINRFLYHYIQRPNSIMERVRANQSSKTIDHLYIFDSIYQHLILYNIADKWKELLTNRYLSHLSQAYKYAPSEKKEEIRGKATEFASKYDDCYFTTDCVKKVRERQYYCVKELNDFVVSLTSYPKRIRTVHFTVASLLRQTMRPDSVILWLARSQFPNKENDLPLELLKLQEQGLIIKWWEDIKSYKKLLPALKNYPKAIIITADDDAVYDKDWLDGLVQEYIKNPLVIQCYRGHKVVLEGENIAPYGQWQKCVNSKLDRSSYSNFFTGLGGVLYPPECFKGTSIFDDSFKKVCPYGDDIWFWGHAVLNGYRIHIVKTNHQYLTVTEGTQEVGLWHDNVENQRNDLQIKRFEDQFPMLIRILSRDIEDEKIFNSYLQKAQNLKFKNQQYDTLLFDYNSMKNSVSFHVGRLITWIPRKIRGGAICLRDNGLIYTFKRFIEHIGFDMGTPDFRK